MSRGFLTWSLPALFLAALNSCNFVTLPPAPTPPDELVRKNTVAHYTPKRPPEVQVWMLADKIHTGMVFPYDWLIESGFIPPENFPECRYVTLSWGDHNAYVNQRWLKPSEVIHAIFLPSPAVMECIPINWEVAEVSPNQQIWMKSIPRERGPYVASFLKHCTIPDPHGRPSVAGPSSWGNGMLLHSPQSYYFPRICNVWTGQALEACGADINPIMSVHRDLLVKEIEQNGFSRVWDGSGTP